MGAPDLLAHLRSEGFTLTLTDSGGLGVAPTSALNDDYRAAIRANRSELVALLAGPVPDCADCAHLLKGGTCYEPVSAGLVESYCIEWPPEGYGARCPAFSRKTPANPHRLTS